jgi:hypothetical protein
MDQLERGKFCIYGTTTYQFFEPLSVGNLLVHVWMIRRPPLRPPSASYGYFCVREVETYSFALYENGEIVNVAHHPRLAPLRTFLGHFGANGKKMGDINYEMTRKEAEAFLNGLQSTLEEETMSDSYES